MRHTPVLLEEVVKNLNLSSGSKVVDATLGDAGHSLKILEVIGSKGKLLGIDIDPEAILRAKQFLYDFENNTIFARDNFVNLKQILEKENFDKVDAILMDLGWSTPQFEERGRGFSFQKDELLDMRFGGEAQNETDQKTAAEILSEYGEDELVKIFHEFGEEKFAREIAKKIVECREQEKILNTRELRDIVEEIYRKKGVRSKINPATKIFQALRIEVNKELDILKKVLPQAVEVLKPGGRLAVITFHSLEDRIVKHFFKSRTKELKIITRKPITPSEKELNENPRSRSAKLRVVEKI